MIEHEDGQFDDAPLRPFELSKRVARNFKHNLCEIGVVYGMPEGIGKSTYVNSALADLHGFYGDKDWEHHKWMWIKRDERPKGQAIWDCDWEKTKASVKYLPEDVVKLCMGMIEKEQRAPCFHWDDAGTWLNAMSWADPFVIAFMRYLSLARTNWGMVILSTPVEEWVLKKLRTARGLLHAEVAMAPHSNYNLFWRPRIARVYSIVRYIGKMRPYFNSVFEDLFVGIMPDSFYDWYKPTRDKYARVAVQMMRQSLEKRKDERYFTEDLAVADEIDHSILEKHVGRANDVSADLGELVAQKSPRQC